jgi:hypothetical protein
MASNPQRPTRFTSTMVRSYATFSTQPTTYTTASAITYTADGILNNIILRDPNGAGRADLFPTAASIMTELQCESGDRPSFTIVIRNTADAAETITMTTNTGLTLSGTMTIAQNNSKTFLFVATGDAAFTVYSLGTVVH